MLVLTEGNTTGGQAGQGHAGGQKGPQVISPFHRFERTEPGARAPAKGDDAVEQTDILERL